MNLLLTFLKKYKREYLKGFFFTILSALLSSFIPMVVKFAIDALEDMYENVIYYGLLIAALGIARSVLLYFGRNIIVLAGRFIEKDIREKIFEKLLITRTEFFDEQGTGKISSQIINDVEGVRMMLGFGGMIISHITPIFVFSVILEILISPMLAVISFVPLFLIPILVILYEKKIFYLSEIVQERISEITNFSHEIFSKIKVIKNYNIESDVDKRFSEISGSYSKANLLLSGKRGIFEAFIVFFSLLSLVVVIVAGSYFLDMGLITKGDLAGFIAYQLILIWPAMAIGYLFVVIQRGFACLWRLNKILEQPQDQMKSSDILLP